MSNYDDASPQIVVFTLGGMTFEYDEEKNQKNIAKHGISFRNAARVFFDYDRIEFYDEEHSENEDRYDTDWRYRGRENIRKCTNRQRKCHCWKCKPVYWQGE